MSINVFIINSEANSRNTDMNICLMIRDVRVYGCLCPQDAVSLSETVTADFVFFRLLPDDEDPCQAITEIIKINKDAIIAVCSYEVRDSKIFEKPCRQAGATSYFSEDISKDKLLYLVKNFTDIIRKKQKKREENKLQNILNSNFLSFVEDITGYNDILAMNKQIANLDIKPNIQKNLTYIRVFSFLYDFLVKCFLNDVKISVGLIADSYRIMICFPYDDKIDIILKSAAFYSISEKYIKYREEFCCIYIDIINLDNSNNTINQHFLIYSKTVDIEILKNNSFTDVFSKLKIGMNDIDNLLKISEYYEDMEEIFHYFTLFLKNYKPTIELEYIRDYLQELLENIDKSLYNIAISINEKRDIEEIIKNEDILYENLIKFKLMLHLCKQNR